MAVSAIKQSAIMKQLSREHQTIASQKAAFAQFRPAIEDEQSVELLRFYDCIDGAVSCLILSELHMRQGDRCKALNVFPELTAHSYLTGTEHNLKALNHLANAQAFLWKFRNGLQAGNAVGKPFMQLLDDFRHEMREGLSQLEVKASDAAELGVVVDEVCAVFRSGATDIDVFSFIDTAICGLEALRKTPGRGAETNIAAWKLPVAQIMTAAAAWVAYQCHHSTCRCAQTEKAVQGAVLAVASVVHAA